MLLERWNPVRNNTDWIERLPEYSFSNWQIAGYSCWHLIHRRSDPAGLEQKAKWTRKMLKSNRALTEMIISNLDGIITIAQARWWKIEISELKNQTIVRWYSNVIVASAVRRIDIWIARWADRDEIVRWGQIEDTGTTYRHQTIPEFQRRSVARDSYLNRFVDVFDFFESQPPSELFKRRTRKSTPFIHASERTTSTTSQTDIIQSEVFIRRMTRSIAELQLIIITAGNSALHSLPIPSWNVNEDVDKRRKIVVKPWMFESNWIWSVEFSSSRMTVSEARPVPIFEYQNSRQWFSSADWFKRENRPIRHVCVSFESPWKMK